MSKLIIAAILAATMTTSALAMDVAQAESDLRACISSAVVAKVVAKDPNAAGLAAIISSTYAHGPEGDQIVRNFTKIIEEGRTPAMKDGSPIDPAFMVCFNKFKAALN